MIKKKEVKQLIIKLVRVINRLSSDFMKLAANIALVYAQVSWFECDINERLQNVKTENIKNVPPVLKYHNKQELYFEERWK